MKRVLSGLTILVVGISPQSWLHIAEALQKVGAEVTLTNTVKAALLLVDHGALSGAILDHTLGDDDSSKLRDRLAQHGVPFVVRADHESPEALVAAIAGLISN